MVKFTTCSILFRMAKKLSSYQKLKEKIEVHKQLIHDLKNAICDDNKEYLNEIKMLVTHQRNTNRAVWLGENKPTRFKVCPDGFLTKIQETNA